MKPSRLIKILTTTLIMTTFLSGCSAGCSSSPPEYGSINISGSESFSLLELLSGLNEKAPAELPIEESKRKIEENTKLLKLSFQKLSLLYPEDMEAAVLDSYTIRFLSEDGTTVWFKKLYSENFTDTENLASYGGEHVKRLRFKRAGKEYKGMLYDRGEWERSFDPFGNEIITECPKLSMMSEGDYKAISPEVCVSYIDKGADSFLAAAISDTRDKDELMEITRLIAGSIEEYLPSKEALDLSDMKKTEIQSGITILLPESFEAKKAAGFIKAECKDTESIFFGNDMYFYKAGEDIDCEAVNLPQQISPLFIKDRYPAFNGDLETDILFFKSLGRNDMELYYFDIRDIFYPHSKEEAELLPSEGNILHSYRLSFHDDAGSPMVFILTYTKKTENTAYKLFKAVAETIAIR